MDDTSQFINQEVEEPIPCPENGKDAEPNKEINEVEEIVIPQIGMLFDSVSEVKDFYKRYASNHGFEVITRTTKNSGDGIIRYYTFSCAKSGKGRSTSQNPMLQTVTNKTDCKAKINVKVLNDGRLCLSTIFLEHNHELSVAKVMSHSKKLNTWEIKSHNQGGSSRFHNYGGGGGRLILNVGDAQLLNNFFIRMTHQDPNFFYIFDWNEDCYIRNVFWADAKSRALYESFGDAIAFDTTYINYNYDLPLVTFIGVNHHGQTMLLGCGLLSNKQKDSYAWLFKTFLACMSRISPKAIVTDDRKEIRDAVAEIFPEANYRLCLSQILQKLPLVLGTLPQYREIKRNLKNIVFESLTVDEFEEEWVKFIMDYNLHGNELLSTLYVDRKLWVPVFIRETFWAGLSTTKRSEKRSAFFDGCVDPQTSLMQFLELYESFLKNKVEKEKHADFSSSTSVIPLLTYFPIEKQFQQAYTNEMFKKVQEEFKGLMYCNSMLVTIEGNLCTYQVTDHVEKKDVWKKNVKFDVLYDKDESDIKCTCRMFEFGGILCRHILAVLVYQDEKEVPLRYILPRWRKDIERKHTYIGSSYDDSEKVRRYNMLWPQFQKVAELAAKNKSNNEYVMNALGEIKEKLLKDDLSSVECLLNKEEQSMRKNEKTGKGEKNKYVGEASCSRQLKKKKVSETNATSVLGSDARLNNLPPINSTLHQADPVPYIIPGTSTSILIPAADLPQRQSNNSINFGRDSVSFDLTRLHKRSSSHVAETTLAEDP